MRRTWAAFMQDALYDPERGFFTRSPVGREFVTAPHLSAVFASCVARLLDTARRALGDPMTFVELACSDGTLAEHVAMSAPGLAANLDYLGIDVDVRALDRLTDRAAGFRSVTAATSLSTDVRGLVFANELFDNVPFHRLRRRGSDVVEVFVEDAREVLGEPTPDAVRVAHGRVPEPGAELFVSPSAEALVAEAIGHLKAGWLVAIDYGFEGSGTTEPVRGYRGHLRVDPLVEPEGSCDITGPVDLDGLAAAATRAGARVTRTDQATFLRALGFDEFVAQLDEQQVAAQHDGDAGRAMLIQQLRDRSTVLVDPRELGSFVVLIAAVGDVGDVPVRLGEAGSRPGWC